MFNSPTKAEFKVYLPKFLPNDMNKIFSDYFFKETTMPYRDVHEALFESQILGFEIPALGVGTVIQNNGLGGEISQLPSRFTHEKYGDTRLVVNIRCIDAYINYHLARYAFFIYTNPVTNTDPSATGNVGDIIVNFNTFGGMFRYTLIYKNCIWVGVDGKEFTYDASQMRFDQFGLIFTHNGFDIIPVLNGEVMRSKGLNIEFTDEGSGKRKRKDGIIIKN